MKKVVFYCQHLLGIGHVTRSLSIVNELARDFAVTYVQGGPEVPLKPVPAVRLLQLAPLLMREHDSSLYDPAEKESVADIFAARATALSQLAQEKFDAVVIELFPFGRKKFGPEVLAFIAALKETNPSVLVITSVRDILVEKSDSSTRNQKIVNLVKEHFHAVWVHADSRLIRFGDTFPLESEIAEKIVYTGFVAEPPRAASGVRSKKILLSLGGGSVGEELYRAAALVVPLFPEFEFQFVLGPYTDPNLAKELNGLGDLVQVSGLLTNFEEVLSTSALSISMAGYNTVMNLLNTKTPALVLAYGANHEQNMRARLLEQRDYLKVIAPEDLVPARLEAMIRERLNADYPKEAPDLGGSRRAREWLLGAL